MHQPSLHRIPQSNSPALAKPSVSRRAGVAFIAGTMMLGMTGCTSLSDSTGLGVAANDNSAPGPTPPPPAAAVLPAGSSFQNAMINSKNRQVPEQTAPKPEELLPYLLAGKDCSHVTNLDPDFKRRLAKMFAAMPPKLQPAIKIFSGYRSYEHQARLFEAAVRKYGSPEKARRWVAPPGNSKHNYGLAVDLQFAVPDARSWVHRNAEKFGLHFPMNHEPWHIEPIGARGKKSSR